MKTLSPWSRQLSIFLTIVLARGIFGIAGLSAQECVYGGGLSELGDGQPPPGFPGAGDIARSTRPVVDRGPGLVDDAVRVVGAVRFLTLTA